MLVCFTSSKPTLFIKESAQEDKERNIFLDATINNKTDFIQDTISSQGLVSLLDSVTQGPATTTSCIDKKWAWYPGKNPYKLSDKYLNKLKELVYIGKKTRKTFTAERVHKILMDDFFSSRDLKLYITVPKINTLFSFSPTKTKKVIESE